MNHNFIRLNSNNNIETKKIFFVVLRKIHGEIDWILPLVNSFNKNYLFIGIIENIKEIMKNTSSRLDLIMFPKVNSAKEVRNFNKLVTNYEKKFNIIKTG